MAVAGQQLRHAGYRVIDVDDDRQKGAAAEDDEVGCKESLGEAPHAEQAPEQRAIGASRRPKTRRSRRSLSRLNGGLGSA
jgi:hypothetical protein